MLPKSLQLWPSGAASFSHTSSFPERPLAPQNAPGSSHRVRAQKAPLPPGPGSGCWSAGFRSQGRAGARRSRARRSCARRRWEKRVHTRHTRPSPVRPSVIYLSPIGLSIVSVCLPIIYLSPVIYCLLTNHLLAAGRFKPRVGRFANAARADLYTRLGCRALCPGLPAAGFLEDTVGCEREEVSPFLPQLLSGSPQSQRGPLLQPRLLRAPQTPRVPPGPRSAAPCARRPGSWSRWSRARRRGPALPPAALGTGPRAHLPETPCAVSSL